MEDALIRHARESDLQRIHEIYNDAVLTTTATWDYEPWPWETRLAWWREHEADPTCPVFVSEVGAEVAGFAYLSWFRSKIGYRFTREDTIYIDPAYQGMGLARPLLSRALEAARGDGMRTVLGVIEASNERSIRLHEGLGFVETARLPATGFKFGRWLDCVYLQLTFPEPGT
ncbi:MAG: N-acetyltransferase family protein [Dehalococcoidia bacterium]